MKDSIFAMSSVISEGSLEVGPIFKDIKTLTFSLAVRKAPNEKRPICLIHLPKAMRKV